MSVSMKPAGGISFCQLRITVTEWESTSSTSQPCQIEVLRIVCCLRVSKGFIYINIATCQEQVEVVMGNYDSVVVLTEFTLSISSVL